MNAYLHDVENFHYYIVVTTKYFKSYWGQILLIVERRGPKIYATVKWDGGFTPSHFKIEFIYSVNFITHHYSNTTFLQGTWSNVVCKSRPCSSSPGSITFFKHISYNTSALVSSSNQISLLWIVDYFLQTIDKKHHSAPASCPTQFQAVLHICPHIIRHDLFPISRYIFWKCKPRVFCNREKKINSI